MNNPQFYIFGVPDGFDMYNATPERQNLFQLTYDSDCHDKRKMAIYRNADNGEVSYIYLRYNMLSVKGRPNSFLGMALTFYNGYYCKDIHKLLNLFEEIYEALSNDVILTTKINPSVGQAKYRIGRFAEGTAAIIKIEEYVEEQTRGWFGDCVVPLDETFRLNTQSVSLKQGLYLDTKSEHIIANLKTASWVYLADRNVTAKPVYTITVESAQPAMGRADGGGSYNEGSVATITATAAKGYRFVCWQDNNTDNPRRCSVTAKATYTAHFESENTPVQSRYTLTASSSSPNMGSVNGGGTYSNGTTVRLTATPANGYRFVRWQDNNTNNPRSVTLTANTIFTAYFERDPRDLDPRITEEQKRQLKIMKKIADDADAIHEYISNEKSTAYLKEKREDLLSRQGELKNLQYARATNEWNSIFSQMSLDINKIENILQSRKKKIKIAITAFGVLSLAILLIIFKPKPLPVDNFDKGAYEEYRNSVVRVINPITDDLFSENYNCLAEYKNTVKYQDSVQDNLKRLTDLLGKDTIEANDIEEIEQIKQRCDDNLTKLTNYYDQLKKSAEEATEEARKKAEEAQKKAEEAKNKEGEPRKENAEDARNNRAETGLGKDGQKTATKGNKAGNANNGNGQSTETDEPNPSGWSYKISKIGDKRTDIWNPRSVEVGYTEHVTIEAYNNGAKTPVTKWDHPANVKRTGANMNTEHIEAWLEKGKEGYVTMKTPDGHEFKIMLKYTQKQSK